MKKFTSVEQTMTSKIAELLRDHKEKVQASVDPLIDLTRTSALGAQPTQLVPGSRSQAVLARRAHRERC
eukprot:127377-Hanusia_phi.AAC.1